MPMGLRVLGSARLLLCRITVARPLLARHLDPSGGYHSWAAALFFRRINAQSTCGSFAACARVATAVCGSTRTGSRERSQNVPLTTKRLQKLVALIDERLAIANSASSHSSAIL